MALTSRTPASAWPAWTDRPVTDPGLHLASLSPTKLAVLRLFGRARRLNIDAPTIGRLAELTGRDRRAVRRTVRSLFRRGWLDAQPRLTGVHSARPPGRRYRLTPLALAELELGAPGR